MTPKKHNNADFAEAQGVCMELYNLLMMKIEPDLVTWNIPYLQEKYLGETVSEKKARKEHYKACFVLCMQQYHFVIEAWKHTQRLWKKTLSQTVEQWDESVLQQKMSELESDIFNT